ncbi:hypothetical protein C8R47DRAFT_1227840 [Mycena vitilis]|nr:hypothetical protein C8R47DRAFT_1227840 [Mycena vitilis]
MADDEFDPYAEETLASTASSNSRSSSRRKEPEASPVSHQEAEQLVRGAATAGVTTLSISTSSRFNFSILPGLPALVASLMAAGVASALLGWLLSRRIYSADNSAFHHALVAVESRSNDPTGIQLFGYKFGTEQGGNPVDGGGTTMYGLALSSVATHTISFSTPFVISVFAYVLGSTWLRNQARSRLDSLPTPQQYGHIVDLCGSFGFSSLYNAAQYLSSSTKKRPAASNTLVAAFCAVLIALLLNYSLSLSDLWLHTAATTFSYEFTTHMATDLLANAGSIVNTTLCPGPVTFWAADDPIQPQLQFSNCQHRMDSAFTPDIFWGTAGLVDGGSAVLSNTSTSSQIQIVGGLATLLPKALPGGVQNLIFNTMAMEASCRPVTDCQHNVKLPGRVRGTNTTYFLVCPAFNPSFAIENPADAFSMLNQFDPTNNNTLIFESGTPEAPALTVGASGTGLPGYTMNSTLNPVGVLASLYYDLGPVQHSVPLDQPGWYAIASAPPLQFAFYISHCVLDVWNATVVYSAPSSGSTAVLTLASPPNRSNFNTTSALLAALDAAYSATLASSLATSLEGSLNISSELFSDILAGNISQGILAYAAPLTERTASVSGEAVHSLTASRYPLAPLCMVLALTYGYALLALMVGLAACVQPWREIKENSTPYSTSPRKIRDVDVAHLRLTSARACVADRFDHDDGPERMLAASTEELFRENDRTRRLGVGLVRSGVSDGGGGSEVKQRILHRFKVDIVENLEDDCDSEHT